MNMQTPPRPSTHASRNNDHSFRHWAGRLSLIASNVPFAILWLGFGLLLWRLDARGLWLDEIIYVELERQGLAGIVHGLTQAFTDHHPPAYHVIGYVWMRCAGESDFAVRTLSVFFGVLSLSLTYRIGRQIVHPRFGKRAALLLATMPIAILFTRIARYYALTTTLGLLTTLLFLRLKRRRWQLWIAYVIASALLAYTDYLGLSLLIGQGYLALLKNRHDRGFFRRWLGGECFAALLFSPWLFVFFRQASSAAGWSPADLAFTPTGYALKLIYPLYAFTVGTTILPWKPVAILGAGFLGTLVLLGLRVMAHRRGPWGSGVHFFVAFLAIPFAIVFLVVSFVTPLVSFIAIPDHMIFIAPFFCLLFATGWEHLPKRWLRVIAGVVIALTYGAAYVNYIAGRDFHNPVYAVPIDDAIDLVLANAEPGDIIVSKRDTGFAYHANRTFDYAKREATLPYYEIKPETFALIDDIQPARVWVISFGRDRTLAGDLTPEFVGHLREEGYTLRLHQGYVEQDPTYRQIKTRLLNRPAYQYKLEVSLLAR